MIAKIAWKNIWRNRLRSLLVMLSIILGMWVGTFILAFIFGIVEQRINDAIGYEISHIQWHHPDFQADNDPQYVIPNSADILAQLSHLETVKAVSGRTLAFGMVTAPTTSSGGKFIGIEPDKEQAVTQLPDWLVEGEYLNEESRNKVLIGKRLAKKLKVKLRSKIVLTFQDTAYNIVAGAFRVCGIYQATNSTIENSNLYVRQSDLDRLMETQGNVHEIAMLLNQSDQVDAFVANQGAVYPELSIQSWKEISPELAIMIDSLDQYMVILLVIILLALSFGIINTMLMAVLERVRELGVLMAIGMNKFRLFSMIFLETFFLVGLAAPLGLLLGYVTIAYLGSAGMDVSGLYKEGYQAFGVQPIIYPQLAGFYYFRILILVGITALIASVYPAYTALRLDPVQAIRKI